eukprot:1760629-Prymnesium_polylepis.3
MCSAYRCRPDCKTSDTPLSADALSARRRRTNKTRGQRNAAARRDPRHHVVHIRYHDSVSAGQVDRNRVPRKIPRSTTVSFSADNAATHTPRHVQDPSLTLGAEHTQQRSLSLK